MARPRGGDWLEDEIKWLHRSGVHCLVSLLESHEEDELELLDEGSICERHGIDFINFPIVDRNVPKDKETFIKLISDLKNRYVQNQNIITHCRAGIGRASITTAALLISLNKPAKIAFNIISKYRLMEVPNTPEQIEWVINMEDELKNEISGSQRKN